MTGDDTMSDGEKTELRRVFGAIGDAALPVKTFDELRLAEPARIEGAHSWRPRRSRMKAWVGGGMAVGLTVALLLVAISTSSQDRGSPEQDVAAVGPGQSLPSPGDGSPEQPASLEGAEPADSWTQVADSQLSPRNNALVTWAGDEVLVFGGDNFLCSPTSSCAEADVVLADGAAYDPATDTWRSLADAPVPLSTLSASTAVVGDQVFVVVRIAADRLSSARYSVDDDRWESLGDLPVSGSRVRYEMVRAGESVVAYRSSGSPTGAPDLLYDDQAKSWIELAPSPFGSSSVRSMAWTGGELYLFEKPNASTDGSEPGLVSVARLDLGNLTWEPLAASEFLGVGPVLAAGSLVVNPVLGCSEGATGECLPFGWIYDTISDTWTSLPAAPSEGISNPGSTAGAIGDEAALYTTTRGGLVLDIGGREWFEMPSLDESADFQRQVWAVGPDAFVFNGASFAEDLEGELLEDAWIWRSGRS